MTTSGSVLRFTCCSDHLRFALPTCNSAMCRVSGLRPRWFFWGVRFVEVAFLFDDRSFMLSSCFWMLNSSKGVPTSSGIGLSSLRSAPAFLARGVVSEEVTFEV